MSFGTVIDLAFLLLTAFLALRGLFRGLSGEVLSLAGMLGGLYLAFAYADRGGALFRAYLGLPEQFAYGAGLVAIFVAVNLVAALLCRLVGALLKVARLSLFDRVLGLGAGALKGVALLFVVYGGLLMAGPLVPPQWIVESRSLQTVALIWPRLTPYIGDSLDRSRMGLDILAVPSPSSPDATF